MAGRQPVARRQGRLPAIGLADVQQREGDIARVGGESRHALPAGILPGARVDGTRRQLALDRHLPVTDHSRRIGGVGADDAARHPVIVRNWTVGEGIIGLLGVAVALHQEELLLDIGAFDPAHGGGQQRLDIGPDFLPDDLGRLAQGVGVLAADDRLVGVVVEVDQLGAPADPDRLAGRQHDADCRLEALRPGGRRSERIVVPVMGTDQRPQFAAPREEQERGIVGCRHAIVGIRHGPSRRCLGVRREARIVLFVAPNGKNLRKESIR